MNWESIRANYPATKNYTYLNTASSGLISTNTKKAIDNHLNDYLNHGGLHRKEWVQHGKEARTRVSKLLNCDRDSVAFVPDVSSGMNLTAERFIDKPTVVLVKHDFPSVGLPWIARGFPIQWVEKEQDQSISLEKIDGALNGGNKILAISWVQYNSGFTIDLSQLSNIRKRNKAFVVIDGTQGLGSIPIDLQESPVDVFIASSFKWQTGGYGIAVHYENKDSQIGFERRSLGWNSLSDFGGRLGPENYKETTEVIEAGHPKYVSLVTLNNALTELEKIGWENIYLRDQELRNLLIDSLSDSGFTFHSNPALQNQAPIVCIKSDTDLKKTLNEHNIISTYRDDYIRFGIHFYNSESDIEFLKSSITL